MIVLDYKLNTCKICREKHIDKPSFSLKPAVIIEYNTMGLEEERLSIFCKRHPSNFVSDMGYRITDISGAVEEWNGKN